MLHLRFAGIHARERKVFIISPSERQHTDLNSLMLRVDRNYMPGGMQRDGIGLVAKARIALKIGPHVERSRIVEGHQTQVITAVLLFRIVRFPRVHIVIAEKCIARVGQRISIRPEDPLA